MRVLICDLTGELPRAHRRDLEIRLAALGRGMPAIDAVEVDLDTAGGACSPRRRRARVTFRANHREVARVTESAPTLAGALDQAISDVSEQRETLGALTGDPRPLD